MNAITKYPHMTDVTQSFETDSPILFNVFERPLRFEGNIESYPIDSHKAIVRTDENARPICLGIVGKSYQVLKTRDLCSKINEDVLNTLSTDQRQGMRILDGTAYQGAMCFRQYIFPNMKADINGKSHSMFRVVLRNTYDGTATFKLYSGAIDAFCWNGMVRGEYDGIVRRHTKGLTIPSVTERIQRSIETYYEMPKIWKHWAEKEITVQQARDVIKTFPGISERRVDLLFSQYLNETMTHGETVWALYSAATFYASHNAGVFNVRNTANDNVAATLMKRETAVMRWVETPEFMALAA